MENLAIATDGAFRTTLRQAQANPTRLLHQAYPPHYALTPTKNVARFSREEKWKFVFGMTWDFLARKSRTFWQIVSGSFGK
jgi:hypothetical protein